MKIGEAYAITGSIGRTSKMPGTSYGLPATACKVGSRLAKVPGTVCSGCYALKGNYRRGSVDKAQQTRLEAISSPLWVEAMVTLLRHLHSKPIKVDLGEVGVRLQKRGGSRIRFVDPGWHRWHDSGDLQGVEHLHKIVMVCLGTPGIRHWMPTQELGVVRKFLGLGGRIPSNLVIRVSEALVMNGGVPSPRWPTISSVWVERPPAGAHLCPAPTQDHQCGKCRACWSTDVAHVTYEKH